MYPGVSPPLRANCNATGTGQPCLSFSMQVPLGYPLVGLYGVVPYEWRLFFGYVRVSTTEQNTARQESLMRDLGVEKVFVDYASGRHEHLHTQQTHPTQRIALVATLSRANDSVA